MRGKCQHYTSDGDLWEMFWHHLKLVPVPVTIMKVKAHVTNKDVASRIATVIDTCGNEMADHLAQKGADMHQIPEPAARALKDRRQNLEGARKVRGNRHHARCQTKRRR